MEINYVNAYSNWGHHVWRYLPRNYLLFEYKLWFLEVGHIDKDKSELTVSLSHLEFLQHIASGLTTTMSCLGHNIAVDLKRSAFITA